MCARPLLGFSPHRPGLHSFLQSALSIAWAFLPVLGQNKPKKWEALAGNRKEENNRG